MTMSYPIRQQVYTVSDIFTKLKLRDNPFLLVSIEIEGIQDEFVIQDLYDTEGLPEEFLNMEFRYIRETSEWIPLFSNVTPTKDILKHIRVEVDVSPYVPEEGEGVNLWAFPKVSPREQYYSLSNGIIRDGYGETFDVSQSHIDSILKAQENLKSYLTALGV